MKTDELREKYLEFFQGKGHTRKPSDVLVPTWDGTGDKDLPEKNPPALSSISSAKSWG